MELRQLRHFVALAEEMHFGRAAQRVCITQSALSASIARLEEFFGLRLFERDSKTVRITTSGQLMLRSAREMISQAIRTEDMSRALAIGKVGRIEVGFSGPVMYRGLGHVILGCRRDFPEIEIAMCEIFSRKQVELIRSGKLDAGLVTFHQPPAGLAHIELYNDRFVLCLPSDHQLARRHTIDIALLREEAFVLPGQLRNPNIHDQLVGLCATAGFYPRVSFQTDSSVTTLHLVAQGLGISFVLESLAQLHIPGLKFVPLDPTLPGRSAYFIWDGERVAPGLDTVIEAVRRFAVADGDRKGAQRELKGCVEALAARKC
ncbi:LysR family transcriptional regulator [Variovorax paradoxus]|nr:LysR family transcriptional regulator [Variovorax paradoxus]